MKSLHALSLLLSVLAFTGKAQLVVTQPDELARRLVVVREQVAQSAPQPAEATAEEAGTVSGYRVQLFSGNSARSAKATADYRAAAVKADFPEWATYVTYSAPYWRLRVGDFLTSEEANAALVLLRKQYPAYAGEMRLLRDKVKNGK